MKIDDYIRKLTNVSSQLEKHVGDIFIKNEGQLLGTIKLRLFNTGKDAKGNSLGVYRPITIKKKKAKGQRSSFVTLRDTGDFYHGMFLKLDQGVVIIDSSDYKTGLLEDVYGSDILGLTEQELTVFYESKIEPSIEKLINEGDIDLGGIWDD